MCGIICYVGQKNAKPILIEGLKRLEYRGYDSAGLAVQNGSEISCYRELGKIASLEALVNGKPMEGSIGIAHTRWATHGEPSVQNAHPQQDQTDNVFVIHNGIIENYHILKKQLEKKGITFRSETDTEVLAQLIALNFDGDLANAVRTTMGQVEGTFGLGVIHRHVPDQIVVARRGSPLIIGVSDEGHFVASDVSAMVRYTNKVVHLQENELATVTADDFSISTASAQLIERGTETVEWRAEDAELNGFPHFMLKEIYEQPYTIKNAFRGRLEPGEGVPKLGGIMPVWEDLKNCRHMVLVACGTSYYAAIKEAKRKGARLLGIVNVVGSTISRETDGGIYNHAGPEIGVASTKNFTSQLTTLTLLALLLGRHQHLSLTEGIQAIRALEALPDQVRELLGQSSHIEAIAEKYYHCTNWLYLGRKYNYPIALEGALKLKEVSYIHAEGYAAGEMKHGPIALINPEMPTVAIVLNDEMREKMLSNIHEIKSRKGPVIAIATQGDEKVRELADDVIEVPPTLDFLSPMLSVIPCQLLAYYCAKFLERDIDKPRNLAKSVTVE